MNVYIEKINIFIFFIIFVHILKRKKLINIYYFDSNKLILFFLINIFKYNLIKLNFDFQHIKDEKGYSIRAKYLQNDLEALKQFFFKSKYHSLCHDFFEKNNANFSFFLKKLFFANYTNNSLAKKIVIYRILENISKQNSIPIDAYFSNFPFFNIFKLFCTYENIKIITNKNHISILIYDFLNFFISLKIFFKNFYFKFFKYFILIKDGKKFKYIKIAYESLGHLNFDNNYELSDLSFFINSKISKNNIAIEYENEDEKKLIEKHNFHSYTKNISIIPQLRKFYSKKLLNILSKEEYILLNDYLYEYKNSFNFWKKLFNHNNIKIYFTWNKYNTKHIVINDVLKNHGVSLIWERSYSPIKSHNLLTECDIHFRTSKFSFINEDKLLNKITHNVIVGKNRVDDKYKYSKFAMNIKEKLNHAGAKKIITYYDQNSTPDYLEDNFINLANLILKNFNLGIIIKPKKIINYKKILSSSTYELIQKALHTKRFIIFDKLGKYESSISIGLISEITDLGIANLFPGTSAIESALSFTPTLLIDKEGYPNSPLYSKLNNDFIFNNWSDLIQSLETNLNENNFKNYGIWDSSFLDELDPFKDNYSSERIGNFINDIVLNFQLGKIKEEAIQIAINNYKGIWGKDKVI